MRCGSAVRRCSRWRSRWPSSPLIDVPLALWQYHKSMRMTRQEIRDENKESDGSPEMKARIRRMQQALARNAA